MGHSVESSRRPVTVLIAEDNPTLAELLAFCFFRQGYSVVRCRDGLSLMERLTDSIDGAAEPIDLVVTDIRMPGLTGLEVLEAFAHRPDCPPIICMTAFGNLETHTVAKQLRAAAMFDKPFDIDMLLKRAREICPPSPNHFYRSP